MFGKEKSGNSFDDCGTPWETGRNFSRLVRMKDTKGKKGAPTVVKSIVKDKTRKIEEKDIKKRKGAVKEAKAKKPRASKKAAKAAKDPNAPKRPPTAFFLFLNEFRKTFKEEHPDVKGVTMLVRLEEKSGKTCQMRRRHLTLTRLHRRRQNM
ncbi:hypothetical protein BDL97_17G029200 [Sphagnum fallax]|nr:hypothetical protein BDL97_17G029200 [Sphagnum fallax]